MKTEQRKSTSKKATSSPDIPFQLVEADSPDGPWTPIPRDKYSARVVPEDEARQRAGYYWTMPVDCQTTLGTIDGVQQVLAVDQLRRVQQHLGDRCTLTDVKTWLATKRISMDDVNWAVVLRLIDIDRATPTPDAGGDDRPDDLMTFAAVMDQYHVSRPTLQRAVSNGAITSYREEEDKQHLVRRKDIEARFPRRKA
jgi:hypothetical protein